MQLVRLALCTHHSGWKSFLRQRHVVKRCGLVCGRLLQLFRQPVRVPAEALHLSLIHICFLLRLRRTGWLEEQPGSYEGEASLAFVPEVTPLLEALEEILNPRVVTYTGKLYKAWQLLSSIGQEKSPYENVLREVDADLDALNRSLRALNASIGHYIDRLTRDVYKRQRHPFCSAKTQH